MRDIKLVEVRSEIAAGTRGASMGVDAMKIASLDKQSDFFTQFDPINVPDANSFLWKGNKHPHAKYIDGVYQVLKNVYSTIESLRLEKKFPIVLAGDHSTATGTIMGIVYAGLLTTFLALLKRSDPEHGASTVLIVLIVAWVADTGGYFAGRFLG
jgi:arginase family enzyme